MRHASFSPDGRRVVTVSGDTARVWDATTGQLLGPSLLHQGQVRHAAFSPDGRCVVSASEDQTARVWDTATGRPVAPPLLHQGQVRHAAFSPDGCRIVTASRGNLAPRLDRPAVIRDGRRVLSLGWDHTTRVWDAATGQPFGPPLLHQTLPSQSPFSPDGCRVLTIGDDKTARVRDAATGRPLGPRSCIKAR